MMKCEKIQQMGGLYMEMILWITLCIFASIGFVHIVAWAICSGKKPALQRANYRLVSLENDRKRIDAQLDYCVLQIAWGMWTGKNLVFLAHEDTEEYVRRRSLNLFGEGCSVFVCVPDNLVSTVRQLADLY